MNLKRLLVMTIVMLTMFSLSSIAQNKTVTGKVTDSKDGSPLINATVTVQGTNIATKTSSDGTFTLAVPATAQKLIISYVGYDNQIVSIGNGNIVASMKVSNITGAEIVVIGYGSVRKRDLTGSVATVTSKDFNQGISTTPEQLITGKVAGVTITSNGGQPGQGSTIRIRQGASLNASNDPLIVIDGVPLVGGVNSSGVENQVSGASNYLDFINPADIETFTVLKDAAATAIYGSRASNGVILITTKKGRKGKPVFNFNTQLSSATAAAYLPVLSTSQYIAYVKTYGTAAQVAALGNSSTDWQHQIYQTALGTNNNLSVAGTLPNTSLPYRVSFGYSNQNGILTTDNLARYNGGIRLTPMLLHDHLKIDLNLNGAITNQRFANQSAIGAAVSMDPTQPVYVAGSPYGGYYETPSAPGSVIPSSLANRNPLALLEQKMDIGQVQNTHSNIQFDYQIPGIPELHANLNLAYEGSNGSGTVTIPGDAAQSWGAGNVIGPGDTTGQGSKTKYLQKINNTTVEFYLNYNKDLKAIKSNINLVAGTGTYDYATKNYNYPGLYANGDTVTSSIPVFPFDIPEYKIISFWGRLIYTYNNKYILQASVRDDGSSRFSPATRWGIFPTTAFTWKINQENFLVNSKTISTLNLRLSYGVTGQQNGIGLYGYEQTLGLSTNASLYQLGNKFYEMYAPNGFLSNLTWEQTATSNVGIDYGFFKNRVTGSIDYYYKNTTNLLNNVNIIPGTNFFNQAVDNVGSMDSKGLEFVINAIPIQTKKVTWDVGFNFTYNTRKITKLTFNNDSTYIGLLTGGISGGTGNFIQINSVGYQPDAFYVYKQIYDPTTGKPIEGVYVDQNRDGQIGTADFVHFKSPFPDFLMGFSTSVTYQKWTLSTVLRCELGNYVYNNVASNMNSLQSSLSGIGTVHNVTTAFYNAPFVNSEFFSDYYVENASFLRMDNISIGYDFGKISRNGNVRLKISGSVQNVFTITKYTGLDPELTTGTNTGIDNNLYPRPRIMVLGASLQF